MKLTNKHLGKYVTYDSYGNEKGILFSLIATSNGNDVTLLDPLTKSITTHHSNADSWKLADAPSLGTFDYSIFGCNKNHVESLVKYLDKRYVVKDKS